MLKFEWNALRIGDKVLVHDPRTTDLALTTGSVAMIDAHKGVHGIGIRVTAQGDGTAVQWPSHLSVHRDPRDVTEPCWRCRALADAAA